MYAEVLQNTRSATVVAVFPEKISMTKVEVSAQGRSAVFTIYNGHATSHASVELPAPMLDESGPVELRPPHQPTDILCARLTMEESRKTDDSGKMEADEPPPSARTATTTPSPSFAPSLVDDSDVPWGAERMNGLTWAEDKGFAACRWCDTPLLPLPSVRSWRDLPREGWEEALELWHCHRPHEEDGYKDGGKEGTGEGGSGSADPRGKSHPATNRVYIARGHGYSGLLYFLFDAEDCINLEVRDIALLIPSHDPPPK
jgi:HECT-like Ubiquitin-conjugating enzyme (E2)-binding